MWIARDKDGSIFLYKSKPFKIEYTTVWKSTSHNFIQLNKNKYPEVKWEDDEPTEVEIVIKKK